MEEKKTFEEAITRLDAIVKALERGEAPLEEALSMFAEGTELIKYCGEILENAEQKVVKLRKGPDGEPEETVFDGEE